MGGLGNVNTILENGGRRERSPGQPVAEVMMTGQRVQVGRTGWTVSKDGGGYARLLTKVVGNKGCALRTTNGVWRGSWADWSA